MGKFISWILGIIILLFAIIFFAWNLLPTFVSSKLSEMMKVDVSIEHIGIMPKSISTEKVKVGNPPGSVLSHALKIDSLKANVPLTRFFDEKIVIPQMTIHDVYLGLEFKEPGSKEGNWTTIMKNLNDSLGTSDEKKKKEVLIEKLVITNVQIDLAYRSTGKVKHLKPIERMEFNNVSSEGGIPTAQITNLIMQEMLKEVFSLHNLENMLEGVIKGKKKGILEGIKGFFSEAM